MKSRIVVLGVYVATLTLGCEGNETGEVAEVAELTAFEGFGELAGLVLVDSLTGEEAGEIAEDGSIVLDIGMVVPGSKVEWWEDSFDPIEPLELVEPFDPFDPIDPKGVPAAGRPEDGTPEEGDPGLVLALETSACPGGRCCDFEVAVSCEGVVCSAEVVGICE